MSGMAEVLAAHSYYEYQKNLGYYRSEYLCECGTTFWSGDHEGDPALHQAVATHHAEVLSAAGFGPVKEAAAKALEEEARDLGWFGAQGNLVHPDTAWAGITACRNSLRARAAAVRGES